MNKIMRLLLLGTCLTGLACNSPADHKFESIVQQAIDDFLPARQQRKDEMEGLIVLIVPLVHQAGRPDDADRLTLQASGYLYEIVRTAGGIPALYGVDADLLSSPESLDRAGLARIARDVKCDLCIILHAPIAGDEDSTVLAASADPRSQKLVDDLCGVAAGISPPDLIDGLSAPAVRLRFQIPRSASPRPHKHRIVAESVYTHLAAFAVRHRESLVASRPTRWPQTAPSAVDTAAVRPIRSDPEKIEAIARSLWPSGNLPPERVAWFCSLFPRFSLGYNTAAYCDPQASVEADTVVLRGATNVPALARTLEAALRAVGIEKLRNEMRNLPEEGRLDGRLFAVLKVSTARTYIAPSELSPPQTQLLYGEPLWLLDRCDGWLLTQAGDGYWGWVPERAVQVIGEERFGVSLNSRHATLLRDIDVSGTRIPAGARLPLIEETRLRKSVKGPTGEILTIPAVAAQTIDDSALCRQRVLPALELLQVPYLFGARSPLGLDCSGMVNNLFERAGLPVARDASQQMLSGKLVATRWFRSAIRPGDRLYFIDAFGKIFHTGIAISSTHFVHAAPPAVQISSLRKGDRLYGEKWDNSFFAAKRP